MPGSSCTARRAPGSFGAKFETGVSSDLSRENASMFERTRSRSETPVAWWCWCSTRLGFAVSTPVGADLLSGRAVGRTRHLRVGLSTGVTAGTQLDEV
jgi:hypothetical protein